jgi:hypothetical protein
MSKSKFITAKELASELEMNERTFRLPETQRRLGLDDCRDQTCKKPIRWRKDEARAALAARGHHSDF